jgi:hypothetical protein
MIVARTAAADLIRSIDKRLCGTKFQVGGGQPETRKKRENARIASNFCIDDIGWIIAES